MDKIYRICIFIDTTLENNTILVPTKLYDELKNDDFVVAKYPVISLSSLIKLSDVNLIKIDKFPYEDLCYISVDIAMQLGIDLNGDVVTFCNCKCEDGALE